MKKYETRNNLIFIYTYVNVLSIERNAKKINVNDVLKNNSLTKRSKHILYKKKLKEKNYGPCSYNKGIFEHKYFFSLSKSLI